MKAVADVYRKVFPKGQMLPVAGERPAYAIVEDGKAHIIFVVMKTKAGEEYVEKVFLGGGIEDNFTMLSDELSNIKPEFAHQLAVEHFVFGFLKAVSIRRYLAGLAEPKEREELEAFFTKSLAECLTAKSQLLVKEAEHGETLVAGRVYIAPGEKHMKVSPTQGGAFSIALDDGPAVNFCKPAVDVLFGSLAKHELGPVTVALILTGMGSDGARGMEQLKRRGAHTLAEAEESCVVYGMPRAAFERGCVDQVAPLQDMAEILKRHFQL